MVKSGKGKGKPNSAEKDMRNRLHLPASETLHLAHSLMELAQGYVMGTNRNSTSELRNNWTQHIIKGQRWEADSPQLLREA